ncbi:interleukin-8-like [Pagrus major]|uniref:interleukin-8-like n=1 Tax=Pagrus major TaxID=143350 RepID=UPI003CC8A654
MNTAIQCIILLACTIICISGGPVFRCMCIKTIKSVDPTRIAGVTEYGLRPYCNKREVIVTLKDDSQRCLDPAEKFTQALLQIYTKKASRVAKMITTSPGTTMSPGTTESPGTIASPGNASTTAVPKLS